MDVVRHRTIDPYRYTALTPFHHQVEIDRMVVLAQERVHSPVSPLRNMVGQPRRNNPRNPCHAAYHNMSYTQKQ